MPEPASTFNAASESIRCEKCGRYIIYSPAAARLFSTVVIPGFSLGALIIDAHERSGCVAATEEDAIAHNCKVVRV